ncbi:MFS transporter [Deinococcus aquaedulcis]|uniref:MFS transporter n=1 Tax=Deinococcus aquaedulcis TaxID=2840455 RepID=UPI002E2C43BC|nr:MFS transporter [Deinococcus aquaedulcis]
MNDRPTRLRLPAHAAPAPPPGTVRVDDALSALGTGRFQVRLLLICGLTFAAAAMEVLVMGFALPGITAHFGLQGSPTPLLMATFIGMLLGAPFWGLLADRLGRRPVFLTTTVLGVVFGCLGALSPNVEVLFIARVLTGFAVGGTMPVDYSLLSEFLPPARRGRFLVLLESFWAVGTLALAALAYGLSVLLPPEAGWRWLLALAALPGVVGLLVRAGVPDSPYWLQVQGRLDDARAALAVVARVNRRPLPEAPLSPPPPGAVAARHRHLLGPAWRDRTFLLAGAWFGMSLGYYGIFSWLPAYLRTQGVDLGETYRTAMILAIAQIPGYLLASLLIEWAGRRVTLVAFMLASAAGAYLFLVAGDSSVAALLTSALLSCSLLGGWGALYAYTPELFPTPLRAGGMGLISAFGRLASVLSPLAAGALLSGNLGQALSVFAAAFIISAGCVWGIGIETRGRPLPDGERH